MKDDLFGFDENQNHNNGFTQDSEFYGNGFDYVAYARAQRKKKRFQAIVAGVLAFVLFASLFIAALTCNERIFSHDVFDYNKIKYTAVDYDELKEAFAEAKSKVNGNDVELILSMNKAVEMLNLLVGNIQYVYVEYTKDMSGPYAEEYNKISKQYNSALALYYDLLYDIKHSKNAAIIQDFGEDVLKTVERKHEAIDEEYLGWQNEVTDIQSEYGNLQISGADENKWKAFSEQSANLLLRLVKVENKIANKEGYDNYSEYAYENSYGRSYTIEDASTLCSAVKQYFKPIMKRLVDRNAIANFIFSNSYYYPVSIVTDTLEKYFSEIGSYMDEAYAYMRKCHLYYGAEPENDDCFSGAYTIYLYNNDAPFLYQYCSGGFREISTFVHEFGHFASYYINYSAGGNALDIAEIQSQGNEMLFMPYYDELYDEELSSHVQFSQIFSLVFFSVVMGCIMDEFQRIIYANPDDYLTANDVNNLFHTLMVEYGADLYGEYTYLGDKIFSNYWWASVSHTFNTPFYYISYAVSAIPALVIYQDSMTDRKEAIREYNYVQQYGDGSVDLLDILDSAGIDSPFKSETLQSLAQFLNNM